MSRKIRAYSLIADSDGEKPFVGFLDARGMDEHTRRSFEYRCLSEKCKCLYHWRRAVHGARPSRDTAPPPYKRVDRPATFVKNPGSEHMKGCPYDYKAWAGQHKNVLHIDHRPHLLLNFDPTAGLAGKEPLNRTASVPALSAVHGRAAARGRARGFQNMSQVISFVKTHFDRFDDPGLMDISMITPDNRVLSFEDYLLPETRPVRFLDAFKDKSRFVIAKIKPDRELAPRGSGRVLIGCEPMINSSGIGAEIITPVVICADRSGRSQSLLREITEQNRPALVAGWMRQSRGDHKYSANNHEREVHIHLSSRKQLAALSPSDWASETDARAQSQLLFPALSAK